MQQLAATTQTIMTTTYTNLKNQAAVNHNLEVQMSQIFSLLSNRPQGLLPSNTEVNPKEHVKAITLRSGKALAQDQVSREENLTSTDTGDENSEKERKAEDIQSQNSVSQPKLRPRSRTLGDSQALQGPTEKSVIKPYVPHFHSPRNTSKGLQISSLFNF